MHMARASLAHRPHFLRGLSNSGKYTALTDSAVSGTTGSQLNKLPLQDLQLFDSNRHMLDVLINQGVDVRTVLWGGNLSCATALESHPGPCPSFGSTE